MIYKLFSPLAGPNRVKSYSKISIKLTITPCLRDFFGCPKETEGGILLVLPMGRGLRTGTAIKHWAMQTWRMGRKRGMLKRKQTLCTFK